MAKDEVYRKYDTYLLSKWYISEVRSFFDKYGKIKECVIFDKHYFIILQVFSKNQPFNSYWHFSILSTWKFAVLTPLIASYGNVWKYKSCRTLSYAHILFLHVFHILHGSWDIDKNSEVRDLYLWCRPLSTCCNSVK